jgi:acetyl esterase/lipase
MPNTNPKPVPYDPEMLLPLSVVAPPDAPAMTRETIGAVRAELARMAPSPEEAIGTLEIEWSEHVAPGPDGAPDLAITFLAPRGHAERIRAGGAPIAAVYNIHGGGMMVGNRQMDLPRLVALVAELGIAAATVDYRLAPEHPDPAPVEDCHAGLVWMAGSAAALGIDPDRLVIMGGSAGGGLSAGVALMARDRGSVKLSGQLLLCPMIDDTNSTLSSYQYLSGTTWTRQTNLLGWACLLGDRAGGADISPYAAPIRATDLSNLPPAFIEAGSAEMFRDENLAYADRIWATGGSAELHVWSGGFHGFDVFAPDSEIARAALASRSSWLRRILAL